MLPEKVQRYWRQRCETNHHHQHHLRYHYPVNMPVKIPVKTPQSIPSPPVKNAPRMLPGNPLFPPPPPPPPPPLPRSPLRAEHPCPNMLFKPWHYQVHPDYTKYVFSNSHSLSPFHLPPFHTPAHASLNSLTLLLTHSPSYSPYSTLSLSHLSQ